MPENPSVRLAIVGFGLAGSTFHAPFIAATSGAVLAAVVARSETARARVFDEYPDATVVDSVAALAGLDIDAAVVATPNAGHAAIADELLDLGIGAVVDKPLATSSDDAEFLVRRALEVGVLLTCYQNRRWDGDFRTVLGLRDTGALGTIHRFESRFERWRPAVRPGWKEVPGAGSGILWDLGPHLVDQAIRLLGPVTTTHAEVRRVRPGAEVADDAFIALTHDSGAVSHLSVSAVSGAPGPRFRVLGTAAAYLKRGMDPQEDALRAGQRPPSSEWGTEPRESWGELRAGDEARVIPTVAGDYGRFYAELVTALRGEGPPPVDPRDSAAVVRILEQAAEVGP